MFPAETKQVGAQSLWGAPGTRREASPRLRPLLLLTPLSGTIGRERSLVSHHSPGNPLPGSHVQKQREVRRPGRPHQGPPLTRGRPPSCVPGLSP